MQQTTTLSCEKRIIIRAKLLTIFTRENNGAKHRKMVANRRRLHSNLRLGCYDASIPCHRLVPLHLRHQEDHDSPPHPPPG